MRTILEIEEMKRLRKEGNLTLSEIGYIYRISRERVRQLIGNTGRGYKKTKTKELVLSYPNLTNKELAVELGKSEGTVSRYRSSVRHKLDGGNALIGSVAEEMVLKILRENGIECKLMPHKHKFDILVNKNIRVEVKSAWRKTESPSRKGISPAYKFNVKKEKNISDYFIFFIVETKDIFIVPSNLMEGRDNVVISYPVYGHYSKYEQYHNRFDFLL